MKTNNTMIISLERGITMLIMLCIIGITNPCFAQQDTIPKKKKSKLLGIAEKAAESMSNKPYYWQMSMTSPVEVKTEKIDFSYKDDDVSLVFWFNHGAGKMGLQGPDHICIDLINATNEDITVKWDELKISNLKGDGVRNKIKQMHGAGTYQPQEQSVEEGEKVQFCYSSEHCIRTYYHAAHYDDQGNWVEAWDQLEDFRVFCQGDCDPEIADVGYNVEKVKNTVVGKEFSIFLPIMVKGELKKKTFTFRIEDVRVWEK